MGGRVPVGAVAPVLPRGGKVKHEALANLSTLPDPAIEALNASLAGKTLVEAGTALQITRSLPHGHVEAIYAMARA